jgi:hypothetical protein
MAIVPQGPKGGEDLIGDLALSNKLVEIAAGFGMRLTFEQRPWADEVVMHVYDPSTDWHAARCISGLALLQLRPQARSPFFLKLLDEAIAYLNSQPARK